jgi:hypothetical protein
MKLPNAFGMLCLDGFPKFGSGCQFQIIGPRLLELLLATMAANPHPWDPSPQPRTDRGVRGLLLGAPPWTAPQPWSATTFLLVAWGAWPTSLSAPTPLQQPYVVGYPSPFLPPDLDSHMNKHHFLIIQFVCLKLVECSISMNRYASLFGRSNED